MTMLRSVLFCTKHSIMPNRKKTPEKIYTISIFAVVFPWDGIAHSESLRAGRSEDRISVGTRFYAPVRTSPEARPACSRLGIGCLFGSKTDEAWRWSSTPSRAEVRGRVELYLYSPSGPSWSILTWILLNISRVITFLWISKNMRVS